MDDFPSPQEKKEEKMTGAGAVDPKLFTPRRIAKAHCKSFRPPMASQDCCKSQVQFPSDEAIPERGWNMFIILKDPGVSILYSRRLSSYLCKCQGAWEKVPLHEAST